ncbi:MAG: gamma-glutamyltransferase [Gammaproteobacteria bacterium]|nr:gamma-glutamyltransferase [Gammaproteobacteria bacterium]
MTPASIRPARMRGGAVPAALALLLCALTAWAGDRPPGYAVASAHPLATQAGIEVLQAGGNAFDAAVAVSAALAVVEPTGSGLGGGAFWLLHRAADGYNAFVDAREVAPLDARPELFLDAAGQPDAGKLRNGALSAAIPGAPAGWAYISARYGRLGLARALEPAIRCARAGFAVDAKLDRAIELTQPRFSGEAAALFAPGGMPLVAGAWLRQPELARTLETVAREGAAGFYRGALAQQLVAGVRAAGGIWSEADLLRYRAVERRPLVAYFRDYRVIAAPPPSAGGVALAQALQQLEVLGWTPREPAAKHLVVEALRRAFRDRARYLGDPDRVALPLTRLTSRSYALTLARGISRTAATPSEALGLVREGGETTHFSILDAEGNRAAGTLSLNLPFGSAFAVPGTGVLLNDHMDDFSAAPQASNAYGLIGSVPDTLVGAPPNAIAPGKRMLSSMSPTFVEGPNGLLILGTPGGSRIVSMVLLGVLGFTQGQDAREIVSQRRYHHQYLPDVLDYEPGALTPAEREALAALGHRLQPYRGMPLGLIDGTYGNMQAVRWDARNDRLEAASDPRAVGSAQVVPAAAAAERR